MQKLSRQDRDISSPLVYRGRTIGQHPDSILPNTFQAILSQSPEKNIQTSQVENQYFIYKSSPFFDT